MHQMPPMPQIPQRPGRHTTAPALRLALWIALLGSLPLAHAQPAASATDAAAEETPQQLDPIEVQESPLPLGSVGGVYRKRLPCIGTCEEADETPTAMQKLLDGIATLFIASDVPEQPVPMRQLRIDNPIAARLDEKLP